ncbi:MAG TPA: FMN-binding negative transcriptional regulator [Thermoanaerobaculia bacterium]|nr:FMN-binding negative transcriptional regulator [Thermoanaerobaculia bacterium]
MYIRASHRPQNEADVAEVIRRNMFGLLVTSSSGGLIASHLPFVFEERKGERGTLFAHMARANAHAAVLAEGGESLVIFQGPHGYISPSWYADRATAPTWDYVAVHCYGTPVIHAGDEAEENIRRLLTAVESGADEPWSMNELPRAEVEAMLKNIVSFEIPLTRVEAKFKLNRGERADRTRTAAERLETSGNGELAAYIRRYNAL